MRVCIFRVVLWRALGEEESNTGPVLAVDGGMKGRDERIHPHDQCNEYFCAFCRGVRGTSTHMDRPTDRQRDRQQRSRACVVERPESQSVVDREIERETRTYVET